MAVYGSDLYNQKLLQVIQPKTTMEVNPGDAYRFLTVLRPEKEMWDVNQSEEEVSLTRRIATLTADKQVYKTEGDLSHTTTIFTSLALLSNILYCRDLKWRVSAAADGTDGTIVNKYQLITFCAMNINKRGTSSARPLLFALAPGEREEVFALTMLAFLKYVRLLFGISNISFLGGLVSDHSSVFTTPFRLAFSDSLPVQCFAHIIRKFTSDRKGNGGYKTHLSRKDPTFLKNVAVYDVRAMYQCISRAML